MSPSTRHDDSNGGIMPLLERQADLLEAVDALAARQAALIDAGDADALLKVLHQRGSMIDEVRELSTGIEQILEARPAGAESNAREEAMHARVRELAEKVAARDAEDQSRLEEARATIGATLSRADRSRTAVRAYAPARVGASPRFKDELG